MTNEVGSKSGPNDQPLALREALILGHAPRLSPLPVDEMTHDLVKLVSQIISVNVAVAAREPERLTDLMSDHEAGASSNDLTAHFERLPEIIRTMLRHPELFARQTEIGMQLLGKGALPGRDRELAILRMGWLCRAPYEWGEHVHIAKALGVTSEEIERITLGSAAPGWAAHERAILRAVEELHKDAMISDATWAVLSQRYDDRQLIELPVVIGQYQTIAYSQNSRRLRLHEGNLGLKAR
jgi:alkylhydroperoxidase family enzyme